MRLVQFSSDDAASPHPGLINGDDIIDLPQAGANSGIDIPETMTGLLSLSNWRDVLNRATTDVSDAVVPQSEVSLTAPVTEPRKVVCVGLNYMEHVDESDREVPDEPVLFAKFPTAITGPESNIMWDPHLTSEVDYEAELAVVMGERARHVGQNEAVERVAGYTAANDVSARDLQFADEQWVRGKTLDTFCPLGPALVTTDDIDEPNDLDIWAEIDDDQLQKSNTGDMIFDIADLISFCSQAFTLEPGDVVLTGTPPGVGAFREPPVYLNDGDEVTIGIESIGELTNTCIHS